MMPDLLKTIIVVIMFITAIPAVMGLWLVLLTVFTRPGHTGINHNPISIITFIFKNPEEVAYGGSLFIKWGSVLVLLILLINNL